MYGRLRIEFTGQRVSGKTSAGVVGIIVGDVYGDVRYSAGVNVPIQFGNEEFNDFCKGELGANFEYVQFTLPKDTEGVLYHQYGRSGETVVSPETPYRRTASLRLDEITFIPVEGFVGVIEFPFTGRSVAGKILSGTVALTYDPELTGTPIIYYSTDYMPVKLESNDFVQANEKRGAAGLTSVKFVLPPQNVGRLYENYRDHNTRGTAVSAAADYTPGTGGGSISGLTFVPRADTTGSVVISYQGTDAKGDTYTGYVHISIPTVVTSSFSDMDKHAWAAASVEYLRTTGIVDGVGSNNYLPGSPIIRGDFMLMLYRAFELNAGGSGNFSDVPAGSYYASATAAGRAMGVDLGGTDGRFRPREAITRQDALVLVYRLLSYYQGDAFDTSTSGINSFSDGRNVSDYAKDAVAALINAGVIRGDDKGNLNPRSAITRAEMAVILHRVLTL